MIATVNQKNKNIAEYKEMENGKIECTTCGSMLVKSGFTKHKKTLKHLAGNMTTKSSVRHQSMRSTTNNIRANKVTEIGIEAVREKERLKKAKQRADRKAGVKPRERKIPALAESENKRDAVIDDLNEAKKDIENVPNKSERIKLTQVLNEVRSQVANGEKTLPQAKKIIQNKVKKVMIETGVKEDCKNLASKLDNRNLKYPDGIPVEPKTLEGYLKKIGNIYKRMNNVDWDCSDFKWLNNTQKVISFLENDDRASGTIQNNLNAVYSILRRVEGYDSIVGVYKEALGKWTNIVKEKRGTNKLTPEEKRSFMPWNKIVEFNDKSWTEEARLLFKLYTAMPPRRNKDYSYMKYIKGKSIPAVKDMDKFYNYIVVNKKGNPISLIINNYKTKKVYKTYIVDLTLGDLKPHFRFSEIRTAIKAFAKATGIKSGELVFPNTKGNIYEQFTPYLNFLFKNTGKKIGVNILRHSFITYFLAKNTNVSDNTIMKMSRSMGNSIEMFRNYRRIDAPVDESDGDDG